jgi:hypothetical protein
MTERSGREQFANLAGRHEGHEGMTKKARR